MVCHRGLSGFVSTSHAPAQIPLRARGARAAAFVGAGGAGARKKARPHRARAALRAPGAKGGGRAGVRVRRGAGQGRARGRQRSGSNRWDLAAWARALAWALGAVRMRAAAAAAAAFLFLCMCSGGHAQSEESYVTVAECVPRDQFKLTACAAARRDGGAGILLPSLSLGAYDASFPGQAAAKSIANEETSIQSMSELALALSGSPVSAAAVAS